MAKGPDVSTCQTNKSTFQDQISQERLTQINITLSLKDLTSQLNYFMSQHTILEINLNI